MSTEGEIMRDLMEDFSLKKEFELREKYDIACYEATFEYDQPNQMTFKDIILLEGLIRTYPIDKAIEYLQCSFPNYPMHIDKIRCANDVTGIKISYPDIYDNRKEIGKKLNLCGFFFSNDMPDSYYEINKIPFITSIYQPKFIEEYKTIMKDEKVLYHASPSYNDKSILQKGFTPYAKNTVNIYPPRIFFSLGSAGYESALQMALNLYICNPKRDTISKGKDERKYDEYTLFTIDVSRIPNTVKFYKDPDSFKGVWTSDNMPSSAISIIKHYRFEHYEEDGEQRVKYEELD